MDRRLVRYFYGQEITRNVNDPQPLNEINTQYGRMETSGYENQIYPDNSQPTDLLGPRHRSFTRGTHYNVYDNGAGPSSETGYQNHHVYGHPQPSFGVHCDSSRIGATRGSHYNVHDDRNPVAGPSSESGNPNYQGYAYLQQQFGGRLRDLSSIQTMQSGVGASRGNHYNNCDAANYVAGSSSACRIRNQSTQSILGARQSDVSHQWSVGANRDRIHDDHNEAYEAGSSSASNIWNHHGYGHAQPPFVSNMDNPAGPSSESGNRIHDNYGHPPFRAHHRDPSRQAVHDRYNASPVCDSVSTNENYFDESSSTENVRNKLAERIKKYYREYLFQIFSENIDRFNKHDWLNVSFTFRSGMKIFQAKMTCPICFGEVSPQNKEKEAGRVPKWDLYPVKRHLIGIHKAQKIEEKANIVNETAVSTEKNIGRITPTEKTTHDSYEEKEETVGKIASVEGTGEVEVFVVENKSSDEKDDPMDGVEGKKVEKLSGTKDFASYLSLVDSSESSSEANSDSNSKNRSDSEIAVGKGRGTRKPEKEMIKKRIFTITRSKRRSSPETKSSVNKRRKVEMPSSSSDSEPDIPDWRKSGVTFGWVKLTPVSHFQPAFIFPIRKKEKRNRAQYIQTKGTLSKNTHPVESIATPADVEHAKKSKKGNALICAIKKFNELNGTNYG